MQMATLSDESFLVTSESVSVHHFLFVKTQFIGCSWNLPVTKYSLLCSTPVHVIIIFLDNLMPYEIPTQITAVKWSIKLLKSDFGKRGASLLAWYVGIWAHQVYTMLLAWRWPVQQLENI